MERKLKRELKKSVGSTTGLAAVVASMSKGSQRRAAVLAEFQRMHRRKLALRAQAGGVALSLKQQQSLAMRTVRAVQRKVDKPILGGLPQTLEVTVEDGVVTLASKTTRHWTEIHNKGGTAGRGAKIPQRETVKVEEQDLDVLAALLVEGHLLPALDVSGG